MMIGLTSLDMKLVEPRQGMSGISWEASWPSQFWLRHISMDKDDQFDFDVEAISIEEALDMATLSKLPFAHRLAKEVRILRQREVFYKLGIETKSYV